MPSFRRLLPILALLLPSIASAQAANDVDWSGVSHVSWQDRRPLCPVGGESFQVRFQALSGDLTSARVQVDDGVVQWVTASVIDTRGPYDIWAAQVPATASNTLSYFMELTDGTDVDYLSVGGVTDGLPTDGGFALDFTTLVHAPVGATLATGGAVFRVWAPTRSTVHVRGQFNGWGTGNLLTKTGEYFAGFVGGAVVDQQYKYYFNSSVWNTDARPRGLNAGDNYNAYLKDPFSFSWSSNAYLPPDLEEMVIYQLHVGTFAGRSDPVGVAPFPSRYVDVTARVQHLADLGVNAVMLNPITEFPGDLSAGYNPMTQWAPEWKYGTPDEFKAMVDAFHAEGIAVLLDIVWNHFSISDNYKWNYDGSQIYFDSPTAVDTPWGAQADFDEPEVRDYYLGSALHWLEEYRIDGYRMDATSYMNISPQAAAGWSLMQEFNDLVDQRFADRVVIAEELPDDSYITRPTSLGGAGFDSQYHDQFTDRLREELIDAGFGDPEMWKIRNIINGSGTYLNGSSVTNYLELHDEAWPTSGGQRMVKTIDPTGPYDDQYAKGRTKLAQGLTLLAPGVPAMLMGTEWLEDTDFGTDFGNRIDWGKKITYAGILDYYQDLIALRTTDPALRADASHQVFHLNEVGNVLAFQRFDLEGNVWVVVLNFSDTDLTDYRVGLPQAGQWMEAINSEDPAYLGDGPTNPGILDSEPVAADLYNQSIQLDLPGHGLVLLQFGVDATGVPGEDANRPLLLRRVFPNPAPGRATVAFSLEESGRVVVEVFDVRGRLVNTLLRDDREAGEHEVRWSGLDDVGQDAPAGIYFLRVRAGDMSETRKLTLLR